MIYKYITSVASLRPLVSFPGTDGQFQRNTQLLTDLVFSAYKIENYPQGIYTWFYGVNKLFGHNRRPFITEPEGYGYVDEYLFKNPLLLAAFRTRVNKGLKLSDTAINHWLKGHESVAIGLFKNLFGIPNK